MKCSKHSKLTLIRAGLEKYSDYPKTAQRSLGEALFWVCDSLHHDMKADGASDYLLGQILLIKEKAAEMVKRHLGAAEIEEARVCCPKLMDAMP